MHQSSKNADVIFLGMATPTKPNFKEYYEEMHARTANLPTIIYVAAAPDFALVKFSNYTLHASHWRKLSRV